MAIESVHVHDRHVWYIVCDICDWPYQHVWDTTISIRDTEEQIVAGAETDCWDITHDRRVRCASCVFHHQQLEPQQ